MPRSFNRLRSILYALLSTLAFAFLFTVAARPAEAATITVCAVGCDHTTIEGALFVALTNVDLDDTIEIGAGTYTLSGALFVNDANTNISFVGTDPATTIIQADTLSNTAAFGVFTIGGPGVTVNISGVTIRHGNRASGAQGGGGLEIASGNVVNLDNVIVTDNRAAFGGGIYNASTLNITNSVIQNNQSTDNGGGGDGAGGGIYNGAATLVISNTTIANNTAVFGGGAIRNFTGGTLSLTNTIVESNATDTVGGGIHSNGDLTILSSSLISNTAILNGGAVNNEAAGNVLITNVTFSENTVRTAFTSAGGAINNDNTVTIDFSTFYQNSSAFSGDTFANASASGTITVSHSLIQASPSGSGNTCNFTGNIVGTNNLSTNETGCGGGLDSAGAPTGIMALANNGGATPTHALGASSNAIDAAIGCPASGTDQRGEARDDLACDIGAFELVFTDLNTVSRSTGNIPAELPGSFGPTLVNITAVNGGDPGTVTITKTAQPPGGSLDEDEMPVTWDISATGGTYDVDISFCYTNEEFLNRGINVTTSNLVAYRWNGSIWEPQGGTHTGNCVIVSGVTAFSDWTIAANTPTAVTLSSTTAASNPTSLPWLVISLLALLTAVVVQRQFSPTIPARVQNK